MLPSQISAQVRASMDTARTFALSFATAKQMNSNARAYSTSPARMPVGHIPFCMNCLNPPSKVSSSMISSWMRVNVCVSSSARAAGIISWELPRFTASAESMRTAGRSRFASLREQVSTGFVQFTCLVYKIPVDHEIDISGNRIQVR